MRTLKLSAATAFVLALVCLAASGARRRQQNPNSLGAGNGPSSSGAQPRAQRPSGNSASKSTQRSKDGARAQPQETRAPDSMPEPPAAAITTKEPDYVRARSGCVAHAYARTRPAR